MTGSFQESVLGPGGESACLASQSTNTCSVHLIILTPSLTQLSSEGEASSLSAHGGLKPRNPHGHFEVMLLGETLGHRPAHRDPTLPTPALPQGSPASPWGPEGLQHMGQRPGIQSVGQRGPKKSLVGGNISGTFQGASFLCIRLCTGQVTRVTPMTDHLILQEQ